MRALAVPAVQNEYKNPRFEPHNGLTLRLLGAPSHHRVAHTMPTDSIGHRVVPSGVQRMTPPEAPNGKPASTQTAMSPHSRLGVV